MTRAAPIAGADRRYGRAAGAPSSEAEASMMDFRLGERADDVPRRGPRVPGRAHDAASSRSGCTAPACRNDDGLHRALAEQGWLAPGWPDELGGQGRDPLEMLTLHEELQRADAPIYGIGTTTMVATVIASGRHRRAEGEIIPTALAGEIIIVLGFSEPEAGSDVAAAQTRAVRDGDEWVINGQKMFTTNAHIGRLRVPADPHQPRRAQAQGPHHVPRADGPARASRSRPCTRCRASARTSPSTTTCGSPTRWRIGEVDGGWATMTVVAPGRARRPGSARPSPGCSSAAEAWAAEATDDDGSPRSTTPTCARRLGRTATELEVARLLQRRTRVDGASGRRSRGRGPDGEAVQLRGARAPGPRS